MHENLRGRRVLLAVLVIFFLMTFVLFNDKLFDPVEHSPPAPAAKTDTASPMHQAQR